MPNAHGRQNLLVVDDDPATRLPLATWLRSSGYHVWTALDGLDALRCARSRHLDLVIADVRMPRLTGFELVERLRREPATWRVPIILVSGWDDPIDRIAGFDLGADDFVTKPVEMSELLARIRAHLRRGRIEQHLRHNCETDELTGVLNRRGIIDALEREYARRSGAALSVLMLDIDEFKAINDDLGHYAGDAALCALAEALTAAVRACDRVGRIGGDEFVVVMPDADEAAARALAGRLKRIRQLPMPNEQGAALHISLSVGAATAGTGEAPEAVLRRADELMYRDKRANGAAMRI